MDSTDLLERIAKSLREGDAERVRELTEEAIAGGMPPAAILDDGLIAGMNVIGDRFRRHEIFLPDVLLAAKAMYAGMDPLKPLLIRDGVPGRGTVAIGTVHGDLHDIGKNLVGIMLKGAGFEVIDLGKDVPAGRFVEAAARDEVRVIGMSALLTTTTPVMREVIERLRAEGLGDRVRTIIGGAPVDESFAREIGADAYAFDAGKAVEIVKEMAG